MKWTPANWIFSVIAAAFSVTGCTYSSTPVAPTPPPNAQAKSDASEADMAKIKNALAKLSPEDAVSAEKQHICPVTKEMLGTMGTPLKVDVKGKSIWICCEGCREELLANADKYIAEKK